MKKKKISLINIINYKIQLQKKIKLNLKYKELIQINKKLYIYRVKKKKEIIIKYIQGI